jgi:beta-catenin-like protein 1
LSGNKRKLPDNPTPELLKKIRLENGSAAVPTRDDAMNVDQSPEEDRKRRAARVEDVEDEDAQDFAPGGDADYFAEEDDEGRFYGGGLTSEQKEILRIFENAAGEGVQEDVRALLDRHMSAQLIQL